MKTGWIVIYFIGHDHFDGILESKVFATREDAENAIRKSQMEDMERGWNYTYSLFDVNIEEE